MKSLKRLMALLILACTCSIQAAYAGQYDIKEMTPRVQQAIEGRKGRYAELQNLKTSGVIKENDQGYVTIVSASGNAGMVVAEENKDRRIIYETIVQQNHLGPNGISLVEKAFADVRRDRN